MGAPTRATRALIEKRRARALELSCMGYRPLKIFEIMEPEREAGGWPRYLNAGAVSDDIGRALDQTARERAKQGGVKIELELQKLDMMEVETWGVLKRLHYVVNQGEIVYMRGDGTAPEVTKQGWAPAKRWKSADELQDDIVQRAERGDSPLIDDGPVLASVQTLLKIAERRAKLTGSDAPIKKQLEVRDGPGLDEDIDALIGAIESRIAERANQGRVAKLARGKEGKVSKQTATGEGAA
jgi:hypothetical protein